MRNPPLIKKMMHKPAKKTNADRMEHASGLLQALSGVQPGASRPEGLGAAMLRLAYFAAAQHRAQPATESLDVPWGQQGLQQINMDKAEHGSSAVACSTRDHGSAATEGSR